MAFNPYIFFSAGQTVDAFAFYKDVFGGDVMIVRNADMPEEARMPGAPDDLVMHASLPLNGSFLMGSDDPTGDGGPRKGLTVCFSADDPAESQRVFTALSDGGEVTMPYAQTAWSQGFGMLTDKFGVPWMIDTADEK